MCNKVSLDSNAPHSWQNPSMFDRTRVTLVLFCRLMSPVQTRNLLLLLFRLLGDVLATLQKSLIPVSVDWSIWCPTGMVGILCVYAVYSTCIIDKEMYHKKILVSMIPHKYKFKRGFNFGIINKVFKSPNNMFSYGE